MKKVSIIVPFYNRIEFLTDLLISIEKQSIKNIELIIVDDHSDEAGYNNLLEITNKFADKIPGIKVYRNEVNSGVSYSRNQGIDCATGDYILFLDSDDMLCGKYSLEIRIDELENSEYDAAIGFSIKIDKDNKVIPHKSPDKTEERIQESFKSSNKFIKNFVENYIDKKKVFFFIAGGTLFKKQSLDKVRFDNKLRQNEDIVFFTDLVKQGLKFKLIKAPVYFKRRHGNHLSSNTPKEVEDFTINALKSIDLQLFEDNV